MKNEAASPGARVRGSRTGRPIMAALDLLGRRGSLRVLWELRAGEGFTFRALQSAAELPPATLNTRLRELRDAQIIDADDGYKLSPLGKELIASLVPLVAWSDRWAGALAKAKRAGSR
jgi:DNA-binding HxlR family transcriptional regulator